MSTRDVFRTVSDTVMCKTEKKGYLESVYLNLTGIRNQTSGESGQQYILVDK